MFNIITYIKLVMKLSFVLLLLVSLIQFSKSFAQANEYSELFEIHKSKMKSTVYDLPHIKDYMDITVERGRYLELKPVFKSNSYSYYYVPFKTNNKSGYLFQFFSCDSLGYWYMNYSDIRKQNKHDSDNNEKFFTSLDAKNDIKIENSWKRVIIQNSNVKLKPSTEYYVWFSSKYIHDNLKIYIFQCIVDDHVKAKRFFINNDFNADYIKEANPDIIK
jgi:hypothetical protein